MSDIRDELREIVMRSGRQPRLLLPTTTERFVELDQRQQFVAFRLRKIQLGIKQFTIGIESIEQRINTASEKPAV